MRRAAALLAVALVGLALAGCGTGGDSDTYVLDVHGTAVVSAPRRALGTGKHRLEVGQTVTIERGTAVLGLPGDTSVELRAGRRGSTIEVGARPTLLDGDALAVAGSGDRLELSAGGATFGVQDGAARLRRSAGVTFAVYGGRASVASMGSPVRTVPPLRQVTVSDSGALPREPAPLVYDRSDPDGWDVRYLNDAIDLGGQLERRVRVLNARERGTLGRAELREVVPALRSAKGFGSVALTEGRSAGETIVGASIALGGDGDLPARWASAFAFRDEGADWGLVALDQRARRAAVLGVLDGVLDRVVAQLAPFGSGTASTPTPTTTPTRPVGASATSPPTTTPRRGTATTPTTPTLPTTPIIPPITLPLLPSSPTPTVPTPSKPTQPASPPTIPPVTIPPVLDPVQGLLDGLLGGGGGSGGSGSGAIDGLLRGLLGDGGGSGGGGGSGVLGGLLGGLGAKGHGHATVQPMGHGRS